MKKSFMTTSRLLMISVLLLMLASCASSMPPGQVTLLDPPPGLIENPRAFRSLTSDKPKPTMPPVAAPGASSPSSGGSSMPASR